MKFITSIGNLSSTGDSSRTHDIETKILSCNPILEALGNSKTKTNHNSSRFGKYVTIIIDRDTRKVTGSVIKNYLLEKSRIIG